MVEQGLRVSSWVKLMGSPPVVGCVWLLWFYLLVGCAVAMLPELAAILVKFGFMVCLLAVARLLAGGFFGEAKQLVAVVGVLFAACFDFSGQTIGEGSG